MTFIRKGQLVDTKTIAQLAAEAPKQFHIHAEALGAIEKALAKVPGAHVERTDHMLRGSYSGDVNRLIALLAKHKVTDFTLENTDLESTFMKYYEGEEEKRA